jgi:N-acetylglucosamine-6-phosphate deacetylase
MILTGEQIVTANGIGPGELVIENGRIAAVREPTGTAGVLDLGRRPVLPGYIDLHVHGGGGAQCNTDDPDEVLAVARFHARHGTTALLATTVSAEIEELEAALNSIAASTSRGGGAAVLGAHLEGPFISRRRPGAMDPATFIDPDEQALQRLLHAGAGGVRMMTLAPELPGALDMIRALGRAGVIASIGHSDATYDETRAAVDAGARCATHTFNAMPPLHHREPGLLGGVLDLDELTCEMICDGVHVHPAALRLVFRAKGMFRSTLVTDAMQAAGMPDGEYRLGSAIVTVSSGRAEIVDGGSIAGSTLTMDAAVSNAVRFLGISLEQAAVLASGNPARLLGIDHRKGAIAPGFDADLTILDEHLHACGTLVAGEWVHEPPRGRVDAAGLEPALTPGQSRPWRAQGLGA